VRSEPRTAALCAFVLAVGVAASGTAVALSREAGDSGIRGRVVPCGIVLERPAPCSVIAKPGSVVVGHGDRIVRRAKVRRGGRFRARLGPGRYWLQPRAGKLRGRRTRATVSAGKWTTVTIPAGQVSPPATTGRR
jgi:hypothetical protein